jgi:hypothetical protein
MLEIYWQKCAVYTENNQQQNAEHVPRTRTYFTVSRNIPGFGAERDTERIVSFNASYTSHS